MFDELDKNSQNSPLGPQRPGSGLPPVGAKGTEDIFAEVDKNVKPEVFRPRPDNIKPVMGTVIPEETGWRKNKALIFSLLFGGLIIIVGGGYFGLKMIINKYSASKQAASQATNQSENNLVNDMTQPLNQQNQAIINQITEPVVSAPLDSDQDGLTDTEETQLGINPNNPDSDNDGLTDREEVKVYLTDPLKEDTDGDTYKDGDEVKNGYNPKGAGKLYEIKK